LRNIVKMSLHFPSGTVVSPTKLQELQSV
jgi:hypothetical protein